MEPSALAFARGLHLAAMTASFGAAVFLAAVLPAGRDRALHDDLNRWLRASLAAAAATALLWLPFQAASMSGADDIRSALASLPVVLLETHFGLHLLLRLALLAVVWLVLRSILVTAAVLALGLGLQLGMAHAGAAGRWDLALAQPIHVLAASAWLGGLPPLWWALRRLPAATAQIVARQFSLLGAGAVTLLAATAGLQAWSQVASLPALVGTDYGRIVLAKTGLLVLLLLAALGNLRLHAKGLTASNLPALRRGVATEIALGLVVLLAAAWLATTPPAVHEQIEWPFPWRFDPGALTHPGLRLKLTLFMGAAIAACALIIAGLVRRSIRWPALLIAAAMVALAPIPSPESLFVPAHRALYYRSPSSFTVGSILHGRALYQEHCQACHGADGRGPGAAGSGRFTVVPTDLTLPSVWARSDGDLFWWLSQGIDYPGGGKSMPGLGERVSVEDRWDLIDFALALSAAGQVNRPPPIVQPVPAPGFVLTCGGRALDLTELRPRALLLRLRDDAVAVEPADMVGNAAAQPACLAQGPDALATYALLAGGSPVDRSGALFLIDGEGWIRGFWPPSASPTPGAVAAILARPIERKSARGHAHQR